MKHIFLTMFSIILLSSCLPPHTKEAYFNQYEQFIRYVHDNRNNPGFSWEKTNKKLELYAKTYYQRFECKMSFSEKTRAKGFELEYHLMRIQNEAVLLKDDFLDDIKKIQGRIENYIENDMHGDIEYFKKEVEEKTNTVLDALKQALNKARENGYSTAN